MDATDREDCEIASLLEYRASMQQAFVQNAERTVLYKRWRALNISSRRATQMNGLDWTVFLLYNAMARDVIDELFEFFEHNFLQPMHGTWMKPGALRRRLPPSSIKDAISVGVGDYAKLPMFMFMVEAYVDAFHPGESVSRMECPEDMLRVLQGAAREAVSSFETLIEHMGHGRLPSADMVGHFPSLVMTYAMTSIRARVVTNGSPAAVAKDEASAAAARDWYMACLDKAALEAQRLASSVYRNEGRKIRRLIGSDEDRRLMEEWESVARMLKSYRAVLAGSAGGNRVVRAKSVSIFPYVPFPAYAVGSQRVLYEAAIMRGMERGLLRGSGMQRGEGGGDAGGDELGGGGERRKRGGGAIAAGGAAMATAMGRAILPNPINEDIVRGSMMQVLPIDSHEHDDPMAMVDQDQMSWEESRSRLGPHSLVAAQRAFRLFRDAYWERFEEVGAGDLASMGGGGGRGGDGDATDDEEEEEEERGGGGGGGEGREEEEDAEEARARMTDGARAARVLTDLVCALKEVLLIQGGSYSHTRMKEDKTIENLQEVVHVGLTGRVLPGKSWDSAVAVIRSMFRFLMFKCSLLSPSSVLDLHRGNELRMGLLEQLDESRNIARDDTGGDKLVRERRRVMLDALRFLVETVQRIRWDADTERVVRLSPLYARCAPYVMQETVRKFIAKEALPRRRAANASRHYKCYVCEPLPGEEPMDGLRRTRAFLAMVCREIPDHMRTLVCTSSSSPDASCSSSPLSKPGADPRVRACVVIGVVRHLLGKYVMGSSHSYHQYDRNGQFLSTIPEGYSECPACSAREMEDGNWLPETLAAFDDGRLRRLKRRFHFVARMEAILAGGAKYFHDSFGRDQPNFQTRVDEAMLVLTTHVRRVVEDERVRGWGAWSELEMRAVLFAAIQFRVHSTTLLPYGDKEISDMIVDIIMERACPRRAVLDGMLKRRIRNAEKLLLHESRWGRQAEENGGDEEMIGEGGAGREGGEDGRRPAKRARTGNADGGGGGSDGVEEGEEEDKMDWLKIGLQRASFTAEELCLDHDGCEILAQTWMEVLHETSLVVDLSLEVSGGYYKKELDGLFQRTSGLQGWVNPTPSVA